MLPSKTNAAFKRLLASAKLEPSIKSRLLELVRESIVLNPREAAESKIGRGQSKLGGAPDVPRGFEWPRWKGRPLHFLAQLSCRELRALDRARMLPETGLLSFFYESVEQPWALNPEDDGSWRVL